MPQGNVISDWKATYPNDAPRQKPGGVTVSTTLGGTAVPNKPTYAAGTIQMAQAEDMAAPAEEESEEEDSEEESEE
jgi:hypothetical protein